MTRRANKSEILPCAAQGLSFLHRVPLLRSENPDEFNDLLEALKSEISPRGVVEEMYVADIATIIWETLRLRRCKVALVNAAFLKALKEVLTSVRDPDVSKYGAEKEAERIAQRWFVYDTAKRKVSKMLASPACRTTLGVNVSSFMWRIGLD